MKSRVYDAVVIGSGFGGSASAYALASAGFKTLLLERGGWARRDALDWNQREILIRQRYRSASPVLIRQDGDTDFHPVYPSEVVGGLSIFYGGASLRLREKDFERWPIGYADLERYYTLAEQMLEVHGEAGQDVYEPPRSGGYPFEGIELTPPARRIYEAGCALGYRPFKMPLALNFRNAARTVCIRCITCDGFPCRIEAKNDATTTFLAKAQAFDFEVMPGAIVGRIVERRGRVVSVECIERDSQRPFSVSAGVVVLSAGAIQSPAILLRSGLERFENRRLIGRFLMRHCNAAVTCVFPFRTNPDRAFHKQVCLTDFYEDMRDRFGTSVGTIQDIYTPAPEVLRHFAPRGYKLLSALVADYIQNLLCIAEDEPDFENAVSLSGEPDGYGLEVVKVAHRYSGADRERRDYLVEKARCVLKQAGGVYCRVYPIGTFSHAVGTLRFGADATESVLDRDCRFRGMDNLFVLDGSFMPTSGGVNPSLTITANALRVADVIRSEFG